MKGGKVFNKPVLSSWGTFSPSSVTEVFVLPRPRLPSAVFRGGFPTEKFYPSFLYRIPAAIISPDLIDLIIFIWIIIY
jgi:hypothetical protein